MPRKASTRRQTPYTGLSITSMMDMMTIILVFLLKHFGVDEIGVVPSPELQIPVSAATQTPRPSVHVVVSTKHILVEGVPIVELAKSTDSRGRDALVVPPAQRDGRAIPALREVLQRKASEARAAAGISPEEQLGEGQILLQCDRRLPFDVVRQVMYTASEARFGDFRFVVLEGAE